MLMAVQSFDNFVRACKFADHMMLCERATVYIVVSRWVYGASICVRRCIV